MEHEAWREQQQQQVPHKKPINPAPGEYPSPRKKCTYLTKKPWGVKPGSCRLNICKKPINPTPEVYLSLRKKVLIQLIKYL